VKPIPCRDRFIGPEYPCFIAAEIGLNHNGQMDLAFQTIEAAAAAGADAVKFQNYRTEDFLSDDQLKYEYTSNGVQVIESQYEMFKRCELSGDQLTQLRDRADACGVILFSTPTGEEGVADLVRIGAPLIKNGSDFLTNLPLIAHMARTGIPTVLSTGMSTFEEIEDAVRAFRGAGGQDLILLHCTSAYPTPDEETNLRRIPTLVQHFDCPVGFSDHTWGTSAAAAAVTLGACFVEKHFTLDKQLPGPDHGFSSDPDEFRELVVGIRRTECQLGSPSIEPTGSELGNRDGFRLSCVAVRDLPAGHRLTDRDIGFRRPGGGVPPKLASSLVGRSLSASVRRGDVLSESSFLE
jgi:N,N'-diacetyllegionaminate synthase